MNVQLELWQLISLLLAFFGCVAGFGRLLLKQIEQRLDERFESQEKAASTATKTLHEALEQHLRQEEKSAAQLAALEREFMQMRVDLPVQYVRREDYIRGQSVIEAKLDALYNKLEVVQMRGFKHD